MYGSTTLIHKTVHADIHPFLQLNLIHKFKKFTFERFYLTFDQEGFNGETIHQ